MHSGNIGLLIARLFPGNEEASAARVIIIQAVSGIVCCVSFDSGYECGCITTAKGSDSRQRAHKQAVGSSPSLSLSRTLFLASGHSF